tara:strand:+ start:3082 stop:3372 length:291 start_codon:yes stop_codon:yes gene_type:complete
MDQRVTTVVLTDYPPLEEDKVGFLEFIDALREAGWCDASPEAISLREKRIKTVNFGPLYDINTGKYATVWIAYEDREKPQLENFEHNGIKYFPLNK